MLRPLPERAPAPALDGAPVTVGGKFFFVGRPQALHARRLLRAVRDRRSTASRFPTEDMLDTRLRAHGASSAPTRSAPSRCRRAGSSTAPPSTACASWSPSRGPSTSASSTARTLVAEIRGTVRARGARPRRAPGALRPTDRQRDPARHRALVRPRAGAASSCATLRRRDQAARARRRWSATRTSRRPSTSTSPSSSTSSPSTSTCTARTTSAATSARLQNLAGDKPLVLTEFGVDSIREGEEHQARAARLDGARRLRVGRRRHASSSPGPTTGSPAASRSPTGRSAWSTRERQREAGVPRRAARSTPRRCRRRSSSRRASRSSSAPTTPSARWTRASRRCATLQLPELRGRRRQRRLDRPHARDHAGAPAAYDADPDAPRFILVDQANKGLSVARNVGTEAATRRDHRLHRLRLRARSGLARLPRLQVSCAAASSPSAARTSRRRSRAWCRRPSRCRRAGRRTCC